MARAKRMRFNLEEVRHIIRNIPRIDGLEQEKFESAVRRAVDRWTMGESALSPWERGVWHVCEEIRNRRKTGRDLIQPGEVVE